VSTISERIKALREMRFPHRGKAIFGRKVGVTGATVGYWERGGTPKPETLKRIAAKCDISLRWLLTGDGDPRELVLGLVPEMPGEKEDKSTRFLSFSPKLDAIRAAEIKIVSVRGTRRGRTEGDFYALPLLSDPVAAGAPVEVQERQTEGFCIVHRNWCPHLTDSVFIRVRGDSMEPTIPDGSFVCIDTAERDPECLVGRVILLVTKDGEATIKRLRRTERGQWVGIPDNLSDTNRPIYIMEGDRVVGLVRSVHAEVK
jgi:phage repressor protein C with HTH and peptisase S24 domain